MKLGPFELGKVHQGHCSDLLSQIPREKIDLVLTDPPYNIGFDYKTGCYDDKITEDDYIEMIAEFQQMPVAIIQYPEEMMRLIVPALGPPDEVIAWCYNVNTNRQFRLINIYNTKVDFNKVRQPYKNLNDNRIKKLIKNGSKGSKLYDWFSDIQIVKNVSKEKTTHPCPVPIKLMERIILLTTEENQIVLDPFAGSGTTGIACFNTNRQFLGFELDPEFCKLANDRIQAVKKSIPLKQHKTKGQGTLFGM